MRVKGNKSKDLRNDQSHLLVFWTIIFSKNNVHLLPHSLHLMITSSLLPTSLLPLTTPVDMS